ncbi:MAG: sigma-54-dependent Fis family transcriptional regulator [Gemmatimonadota bacterium]|nr:MAG: sigma-54-dependent Fis family transcriptional regulator [Gemmatimonadota bacterium]
MTLILVVDDVPAMADQYSYDLKRIGGYETLVATSGVVGLDLLEREPIDCVILDLEMPGVDGFDVLRRLRERGSDIPVIVYTGTGNYDRCVQAVRLGAYGFIDKTESMERVVQEIENSLERRRLTIEVRSLRRSLGSESALLGDSPAMQQLRDMIERIAPIPSPVLIVGESGSGKELVARELHRLWQNANVSDRRAGELPFVAINSAALPESLVESELFGHERGAFTGASSTRKGAFEAAGSGTLFLDEVGELTPQVQAKLLRVLEQREITRVGGSRLITVKARVIAATNRNLEQEVEGDRFRSDLYYRLNVHVLQVPPLRDRMSDLPELIRHFLASTCRRFGVRQKGIAGDVIEVLMAYRWSRNNVRELRNIVERMIIASDGDSIELADIPPEIRSADHTVGASDAVAVTFQQQKAEAERKIVVAALERNGWHVTRTAKALGLADHSSLLKIMRRHGIERRGE